MKKCYNFVLGLVIVVTVIVSFLLGSYVWAFGLSVDPGKFVLKNIPTAGSEEDAHTLTVTLTATNWVFPCEDNVTFTYKGASVTYGVVSSQGECRLDRNLGASQVATAYNENWGQVLKYETL